MGQFHEYLLRGGFPQCALVESVDLAQKLLREDIVDKVLKRDMTALFGVRRVLELEQTFLYLCLHDGGLLDMAEPGKEPAGEEAHGGELHLAAGDHASDSSAAAVRLRQADPPGAVQGLSGGRGHRAQRAAQRQGDAGRRGAVSRAVETAFFKHVFTRYYACNVGFSYWRGRNGSRRWTLSPMCRDGSCHSR